VGITFIRITIIVITNIIAAGPSVEKPAVLPVPKLIERKSRKIKNSGELSQSELSAGSVKIEIIGKTGKKVQKKLRKIESYVISLR